MHPKKSELKMIIEIIEQSKTSDEYFDGHW